MHLPLRSILLAMSLAGFGFVASAQTILDHGAPATDVTASSVGSFTDYQTGPGILGGERDVQFVITDDAPPVSGNTVNVYAGGLPGSFSVEVNRGTGAEGWARFVWDGGDASTDLDTTGLGGVDFSFHDGMAFQVSKDSGLTDWIFTFYSDATHYSRYALGLTTNSLELAPASLTFSVPTSIGPSGGANFASIGAVAIDNTNSAAIDTALMNVRFTGIPEAGSLALLGLAAGGFVRRRR